jgi:hypothetical protein
MHGITFYIAACLAAAFVPLLPMGSLSKSAPLQFPGWPTSFENRALKRLPLSEREKRFVSGFPGRMAKFNDGQRTILIRWVTAGTRKLHPASDCFRGIGYHVRPMPLRADSKGNLWGSIRCTREREMVEVRERIHDRSNGSWSDVSSWYWAALLGKSTGPWWAITVVERLPAGIGGNTPGKEPSGSHSLFNAPGMAPSGNTD